MEEESYHVSIEQFEGPLDLLLHLIRKAEIDIRDIFVSQVTDQYIQSVQSNFDTHSPTSTENKHCVSR